MIKLVSQFCFDIEGFAVKAIDKFPDEYLDDEMWNIANDIAPAFNETFINCKLFNKRIDCDKIFFPQMTERGLCYTFNTLNVQDMYTTQLVFLSLSLSN